MFEGKTLKDEFLEALKRFDEHYIPNLRNGVTGPDFVRHISGDVDRLRELVSHVEEPVGLAVSVPPPPVEVGPFKGEVAVGNHPVPVDEEPGPWVSNTGEK